MLALVTEAGDTLQAGIERFQAAQDQARDHAATLAAEHERKAGEAVSTSAVEPDRPPSETAA